jgi:Tol biopolymer transport system component
MDQMGSLSGDGNTLAFLSNRGDSPAVWVRDLRTKRDRRIAAVHPTIISFMHLSPDGKQVAFTRDPRGPAFVVPTGGGEPAPIGPDRSMPLGWKTSEILRLYRINPTADKAQYVEISVPSKHVIWESEWMDRRTPCKT